MSTSKCVNVSLGLLYSGKDFLRELGVLVGHGRVRLGHQALQVCLCQSFSRDGGQDLDDHFA